MVGMGLGCRIQAMRLELEVPDNFSREMTDGMSNRGFESGMEFTCGGQSAGLIGGLQKQHTLPALGKIGRTDQAIVPGSDDD